MIMNHNLQSYFTEWRTFVDPSYDEYHLFVHMNVDEPGLLCFQAEDMSDGECAAPALNIDQVRELKALLGQWLLAKTGSED